MGAVATGAVGRHQQAAFLQRASVNRIHIELVRIGDRNVMPFRQFRIAVAATAGVGQLQGVDFRFGMGRLHDVVLAMTAAAGSRVPVAVALRAAMNARLVIGGGLPMALCALNGFEFRGVGNLRNIAMTGRARQWRMHGLGKTLWIDGQGNFFSLAFLFQAGHGMTRETHLVRRGLPAKNNGEKKNNRREENRRNQR